MKRWFINLLKNKIVLILFYFISYLTPQSRKTNKYINYIRALYLISNNSTSLKTFPIYIRIAPTSRCNYRCIFCEIHKDDLLYPNRPLNSFGINELKNYEGLLKNVVRVSFYGGSEEPLLSKEFGKMS